MASVQFVLLLSVVALSSALPALQYPIHASCDIHWTWPETTCASVNAAIITAASQMQGTDGCSNGGEKCLYTVKSQTTSKITLVHETPKKHYKDDLTFSFSASGSGCKVEGTSSSETWYAYLDKGTNYCDLHNLITKATLDKEAGYVESTSDNVCTQYSSRDCGTY